MPTWAISAAGRSRPRGWFLVLPALIANYLGQGALIVLSDPKAVESPFYLLAPGWGCCCR